MNLRDYFDRVVCVSLERRPDRWTRFVENVNSIRWPFRDPERFVAVDGPKLPMPRKWRHGEGTWGCLQSHRHIVEKALLDGVGNILILEDDAFFPSDFSDKVEAFLSIVPEHEGLMLGGQHWKSTPPRVLDGVVQCINGQRTHAYSAREPYLRMLYRHLHSVDYARDGHVDIIIGQIHPTVRVYAPQKWIVGQYECQSDINGAHQRRRFWNPEDPTTPIVVVLGLWGDDLPGKVASGLKQMGCHFGFNLNRPHPHAKHQPVEDVGLAGLCGEAYPFPSPTASATSDQIERRLRHFITMVRGEASDMDTLLGMCHPTLALVLAEVLRVAGPVVKFVVCQSMDPDKATLQYMRRVRDAGKQVNEPMLRQTQRQIAAAMARVQETGALTVTEVTPDLAKRLLEYTGLKAGVGEVEGAQREMSL